MDLLATRQHRDELLDLAGARLRLLHGADPIEHRVTVGAVVDAGAGAGAGVAAAGGAGVGAGAADLPLAGFDGGVVLFFSTAVSSPAPGPGGGGGGVFPPTK